MAEQQNTNTNMKPYASITQLRTLTATEAAEEFDLLYLEVLGVLQPIPADKLESILPVFETRTVYADIGYRTPQFAEIEISREDLRAGLSIAPAPREESFQEMLSEPFNYWERKSFTEARCDYCGCRDCQCD